MKTEVPVRVAMLARTPESGRVKTRLIPRFGEQAATALQRAFTCDLVERLRTLESFDLVVYLSGEPTADFTRELRAPVRVQRGGDLGERMLQAFTDAQEECICRTVVLGSDSPDMPIDRVRLAADALRSVPIVVGPAMDGGYVLLGATHPPEELLQDCAWGESGVLAATLERLRTATLKSQLLEPWYDVDRPEDVYFLATHLEFLWHCRGEDRAPRTRTLLRELLG